MQFRPIERGEGVTLYEQVADRITGLIEGGTLRPGARIPSVRRLSRQLSVSVTTVLEAYRLLEDRSLVEARPQSGYYVRAALPQPPEPAPKPNCIEATTLDVSDLVMRTVKDAGRPDLVPLGAAVPSPEFLPVAQLNRILVRALRENPEASQSYAITPGHLDLRVQIARRMMDAGVSATPDDIVITTGAQEALNLCLRAVTRPGDTVALASPTYYGLLETLEALHLKAFELATDPRDGVCLDSLEGAIVRHGVRATVLLPSFCNPLGSCMPESKRQDLMGLLERTGVPLIEDDVYGDLCFEAPRPRAVKSFDQGGNVLYFSSFSKTLAPGYRIGWTLPGRHSHAVERLKFSASVATATPSQMAVAAFLANGGFDRYLRRLRRTYRDLVQRMTGAICTWFPEGTRVTRPEGGHVLWVELPEGTDSLRLRELALAEGISVVPGPIFSASKRYGNCLRLNCAVPWTPRVEAAMATLGELAESLS